MKCKHVQELIGPYLYGDLDPNEMRAVRIHAQQCSTCREDIRTRGIVVSSLANNAPELSEEDKQRITWSVKGAVRADQQERRGLRLLFGPATAYTMAAAVLISLITIKLMQKSTPASSSGSRAVVTVREDTSKRPKKESTVIIPKSDAPEQQARSADTDAQPRYSDTQPRRRRHTSIASEIITNAVQPATALTNRHVGNSRTGVPEGPAKVVPQDNSSDAKVNSGESKLPKPSDQNDAQTAAPSEPIDETQPVKDE